MKNPITTEANKGHKARCPHSAPGLFVASVCFCEGRPLSQLTIRSKTSTQSPNMKTFKVKALFHLTGTVDVPAKSQAAAERTAEVTAFEPAIIHILPGQARVPAMVFQGETTPGDSVVVVGRVPTPGVRAK
jgi:hypothetical protein